jgi:rhamnulokinase
MSQTTNILAVDLGASSGRVMLGQWDGRRFDLRELHRFPNGSVSVLGRLHWDVLRLWQEIRVGIARYATQHAEPPVGIDTWAVDFALLDGVGEMLGNPYHYRDRRTEGIPEYVDGRGSPQRLYEKTGIQRLPINTLYQLLSMRKASDPRLDAAQTLLLIPDLFHYWMTGRIAAEYTNATTTQFYDARAQQWALDLFEELGLPTRILPPIVAPGTVLGDLLPEVCSDVGLPRSVPVIPSASHDTASAVAAVRELDERSAYISSGTWSLVGVETPEPILSERARELNFTNEGGVGGPSGSSRTSPGSGCSRNAAAGGSTKAGRTHGPISLRWPSRPRRCGAWSTPTRRSSSIPATCPGRFGSTAGVAASPSPKATGRWCAADWRAWR